MAITLNKAAVDRAKYLIKAGEIESFDSNWEAEKPTPSEVERFIDVHDMSEYGEWFLGKNDQFPDNVKQHYEYPHGDLKEVQRSALVHTIAQAEKKGHKEIVKAAKELLELVDKKAKK